MRATRTRPTYAAMSATFRTSADPDPNPIEKKSTTPSGVKTRLRRLPIAPPMMRPSARGAARSIRARSRLTGIMNTIAASVRARFNCHV